MTKRSQSLWIRLALATVRLFGFVVPRRDREEWRREWESEILHGQQWTRDISLVRHSLGSLSDAAWLRRQFTRDSDIVQDARHAFRIARARPGVFVTATIVLAFAIGIVAATGTAVYHFVLRPLPYPDESRLVTLWQTTPASSEDDVAPANFLDWRERNRSFTDVAAAEPWSVDLTNAGAPEVVFALKVTAGFFDVVGISPALGRTFGPNDHVAGRDRVVILSDGLWRRRFGADPHVVGRMVTMDEQPYEIVGVLPPNVDLGLLPSYRSRDAWLPNVITDEHRRTRTGGWWNVVARLRPDVSMSSAVADLDAISITLAKENPNTNDRVGAAIVPLHRFLRRDVDRPLTMIAVAACLVLLVACANVANLLITLGVARAREFAVRGAIGAGRLRLLRQLLLENSLVIAIGGALGLTFAAWTLDAIRALIPSIVPRAGQLAFGSPTVAIAALACVLALIVCGIIPALALSRPARDVSLRESQLWTGGPTRRRLRDGLAITEVAFTLVLITASGLLFRSFERLMQVDPGFTRDRVAALQVFAWDHHPTPESRRLFLQDTLDRMRHVSGVAAAGAVSAMPFIESNIGMRTTMARDGGPPMADRDASVFLTIATDGYLETMRVPLQRGRVFSTADRADTEGVVVISESTARRFWGAGEPVGASATVRYEGKPRTVRVIGVVGDVRHTGLDGPARAEVYLPHAQAPFGSMTYAVRTAGDPAPLLDTLRAQVWAVDPLQTFYDVAVVDNLVNRSVAPQRLGFSLVSLIALGTLVVAAIGVYGVISSTTSLRTREIGVRIALGASTREVRGLVLRHGLSVAACGLAVGAVGSFMFSRLLQGLLFGVSSRDPLTFIGGGVTLAAIVGVASWLPARRASRVDPLIALRP